MDRTDYRYLKQPDSNGWVAFLVDCYKYGLKVARENLIIRKSIERAFLDSGIGIKVNRQTHSSAFYLKLPETLINREKGLKISIRNSPKFQDKLSVIDISSALDGYVVESSYLTEDRDFFVYECEPVGIDYQNTFDTFGDFKEYVKSFKERGKIPIDKRLVVSYSHMIITGMTGSGKTTAVIYLLLFLEMKLGRNSIYVIDPKEEALATFSKMRGYNTTGKNSEILPILRDFVDSMDKRKKVMRKCVKNTKKFDSDALGFGLCPHFLFVDELAALNATLTKDEKAEFYALLSRVILIGRSLGFYVVLSLQQNNAKELSTSLKEQIGFKVVLGNSGKQSYLTLFDDMDGASGLLQQRKKIGEGVYTNVIDGETNLKKLRFPHLKFLGNKYK